ncbi:MAG: hypothetical protein IPN44_00740 [Flavobacteriales bacterium]|nr:hypothetical protein [Flavobacteriales bacterium]
MRNNSRMATLLAGCALALTLITCGRQPDDGDTTAKACAEGAGDIDRDENWGTRSDVGQLFFAGVLVAATIVQLFQLRASNKTASEALIEARKGSKATRDSVEAYIELERGRLACVSAKLDREWGCIKFEFRNVGRSGLLVTSFESAYYDVKGNFENPLAQVSATPNYVQTFIDPFYMIDQDAIFNDSNQSRDLPRGEAACVDLNESTDAVIAHWRIRYSTDQGRSYLRTHCMVFFNLGRLSVVDPRFMRDDQIQA